jgi:hypothetical protein
LVIRACCPLFEIRLSPASVVLFLNRARISSSMVGVASIHLSSGSGLGQFFFVFSAGSAWFSLFSFWFTLILTIFRPVEYVLVRFYLLTNWFSPIYGDIRAVQQYFTGSSHYFVIGVGLCWFLSFSSIVAVLFSLF